MRQAIAIALISIGVLHINTPGLQNQKLKTIEEKQTIQQQRCVIKKRSPVSFNSEDIRVKSNINAEEMKELLSGTDMKELSQSFVKAEEEFGVNALALAGLVALESGWNTSDRAARQNNLTGYAVYSDESSGKDFSSKDECILRTAKLLKEDYLSKEGQWHNGYSLDSINIMYSSDKRWSNKITSISNKLLNNYNNTVKEI